MRTIDELLKLLRVQNPREIFTSLPNGLPVPTPETVCVATSENFRAKITMDEFQLLVRGGAKQGFGVMSETSPVWRFCPKKHRAQLIPIELPGQEPKPDPGPVYGCRECTWPYRRHETTEIPKPS